MVDSEIEDTEERQQKRREYMSEKDIRKAYHRKLLRTKARWSRKEATKTLIQIRQINFLIKQRNMMYEELKRAPRKSSPKMIKADQFWGK